MAHVTSLRAIYEAWYPKIKANILFATLLDNTGNYLWERGLVKDGLEIIDTGEKVCDALAHIDEILPIHANICAISSAVNLDIGYSGRPKALTATEKALSLRQRRMSTLEQRNTATATDALQLANA